MSDGAAGGAEGERRTWLQKFVLGLDDRLRLANQTFEYSQRPDCVFRIQRSRSRTRYRLSDGVEVHEGDPVIELHFWNEHLPKLDAKGGSIGWGSRLNNGYRTSLRELSAYLDARPEFDDFNVISGQMALGGRERTDELVLRMCNVMGLERVVDDHKPSFGEHLQRFGENILGLMLVMATNPVVARPSMLVRDRAHVAMSRAKLRSIHRRWPKR